MLLVTRFLTLQIDMLGKDLIEKWKNENLLNELIDILGASSMDNDKKYPTCSERLIEMKVSRIRKMALENGKSLQRSD